MAACVDTMMYVREKPWHGLGTMVAEAPTSADAIKLAQLDWKVESKPIYDSFGKEIPGWKANTRDKDNSVLGVVSNRYKIIQNDEAFSFTDSLLTMSDEKVTYETAGSLRGGKCVWLLARMEDRKILGDKVVPYMVFMNTHDGKGSIKVCMTPTRVVCQNTLNLALTTAQRSWTTRHVGDLALKMQEARETLGLAQEYMNKLDIEADKLANIKVSDTEIEKLLEIAYPINPKDTERKANNMKACRDNFITCYNMGDIKQFKGTAWGIINATADLISHFAPARQTATYQENNFGRIVTGHPIMDLMYSKVSA